MLYFITNFGKSNSRFLWNTHSALHCWILQGNLAYFSLLATGNSSETAKTLIPRSYGLLATQNLKSIRSVTPWQYVLWHDPGAGKPNVLHRKDPANPKIPQNTDELAVKPAQSDQPLTSRLPEVCKNWDASQIQQETVVCCFFSPQKTRSVKKFLAHFKATISSWAENQF